LPEGLDGELIYGNPTAKDVFRQTTSIVMSDDKPAWGIVYFLFDSFGPEGFQERFARLQTQVNGFGTDLHIATHLVPQCFAPDLETVLRLEVQWTESGYEGAMIRSLHGRYKEGRSTMNEAILIKLKRFEDSEAVIIGAYEMEHNDNVAEVNELGRTKRSSAQAGKRAAGVLGGFNVRDVKTGVEFNVGSGFDATQRQDFWGVRESLIGSIIKYKYLAVGQKEKPRHPIFLGWRSKEDM